MYHIIDTTLKSEDGQVVFRTYLNKFKKIVQYCLFRPSLPVSVSSSISLFRSIVSSSILRLSLPVSSGCLFQYRLFQYQSLPVSSIPVVSSSILPVLSLPVVSSSIGFFRSVVSSSIFQLYLPVSSLPVSSLPVSSSSIVSSSIGFFQYCLFQYRLFQYLPVVSSGRLFQYSILSSFVSLPA